MPNFLFGEKEWPVDGRQTHLIVLIANSAYGPGSRMLLKQVANKLGLGSPANHDTPFQFTTMNLHGLDILEDWQPSQGKIFTQV